MTKHSIGSAPHAPVFLKYTVATSSSHLAVTRARSWERQAGENQMRNCMPHTERTQTKTVYVKKPMAPYMRTLWITKPYR